MHIEPNYKTFSTEDFVWDLEFRQWILNPDADSDIFWSEWLEDNPEKADEVAAARQVVKSIFVNNPAVSTADIKLAVRRVMAQVNATDTATTRFRSTLLPKLIKSFSIAASVMLIAGAAAWYGWHSPRTDNANYENLVSKEASALIEKVNTTAATISLQLSDGSVIKLAAKSKISYPANFTAGAKRTVYLSGEATFEVAKNPSRPFFVYANGLIVKVLGTRFDVRSYQGEEKASVEVQSGIVSVFSYIGDNRKQGNQNKKLNTLILTRNQKANYSSADKTLIASIVDQPVLANERNVDYNFIETPLTVVFADITEGYGIDVVYDDKTLSKRTLSADLKGTTLYQKLDVICKTMDARYEVIDGKVVIYVDNKTGM